MIPSDPYLLRILVHHHQEQRLREAGTERLARTLGTPRLRRPRLPHNLLLQHFVHGRRRPADFVTATGPCPPKAGRQMARFSSLLVLVAVLVVAAPVGAAAEPGSRKNEKYVLALGDSFTAGSQPLHPIPIEAGGIGMPEDYVNRSGEGYADQLVARLNAEGEKVKLVNLACYYETTATMIGGGGLCSYPHGSQLDEAVQFLHAHSDHVRAVVMTIGGNDIVRSCPLLDFSCYGSRMAPTSANLVTILARLRAEDADVPIAMANYNNPQLLLWFVSPLLAQLGNTLVVAPLAAMIGAAGAPYNVAVVDTQAAFKTYDFTIGPGGIPINVGMVCAYSWMCTYNDVHLNAAGYRLVADAVRAKLGI
jgi:lysophospholipase L1-like esterase